MPRFHMRISSNNGAVVEYAPCNSETLHGAKAEASRACGEMAAGVMIGLCLDDNQKPGELVAERSAGRNKPWTVYQSTTLDGRRL